jgi:ureidoglycolate dehydrogenase (NAD+)
MTTASKQQLQADQLESFARAVFESTGLESNHAAVLADALVTANLRGVDSHGVVRLDPYVRNLEEGGFNPEPTLKIDHVDRSSIIVDADDGPGQVGTLAAMDAAIEAASETGAAFAAVTNSNHFGTAAYYTRRAADAGCIGFAMTNVGPNVAPFGGIDPYFGTNPLGYSIPTDREFDVTLDMATSIVAKGKVHVAEEEGESIPKEWAMDEDGNATTTPEEVHALRPLGGPKGYGLGLLVDVCSGLLSGMGPSPAVDSLYDDYSSPQRVGHFVGAIDISTFRDTATFREEMGTMIDELKAVRTVDGVDEVKLPGEIEAETMSQRRQKGIPLGPGTIDTLATIGKRHGIDPFWE